MSSGTMSRIWCTPRYLFCFCLFLLFLFSIIVPSIRSVSIMVQNIQESRLQYWATRSPICLFARLLTHFAHSLARGKMNGYFFCVFLYSGPWWYHGNLCRPKDAFQKHEHHKKRRLDKTRRRNPLSRKEVRGTTTTTTTTLQKSCVCERYNSNNDDDMKDNDVPFWRDASVSTWSHQQQHRSLSPRKYFQFPFSFFFFCFVYTTRVVFRKCYEVSSFKKKKGN